MRTLLRRVASAPRPLLRGAALRGGAGRAGLSYAVFIGGSGEAPGLTLPGPLHVPLNIDPWTTLGVQLQNTVVFPAMVGVLDPNGKANPGMSVPAGAVANALVGQRFTFTGIVLSLAGFDSVTGPITLVIDP